MFIATFRFMVFIFRFLQRAVQLDSDCTYAYTLLGHEYVLTEEFEKGLVAFRTAARLNPRHYNAWYGIGLIFAKQVTLSHRKRRHKE